MKITFRRHGSSGHWMMRTGHNADYGVFSVYPDSTVEEVHVDDRWLMTKLIDLRLA